MTGKCRFLNCVNGFLFPLFRRNQNFDLDFREHLNLYLLVSTNVGVFLETTLGAAAHNLITSYAMHIQRRQSVQDIFQFFLSNHCLNFNNHSCLSFV